MQFNSTDMTSNEIRKAALLITKAADMEMNLSGYGECAVNQHSGNVYLWLEDYSFTLFIGPSGGDTIYACWSNPENGEEEITSAHNMTLNDLETWAEELSTQVEEEEDFRTACAARGE